MEIARALFAGPVDLTVLLGTPESIEAARAYYEPIAEADFETVHDPRGAGIGMGGAAGIGVSKGFDGFVALFTDYLSAWDSWIVTPTGLVHVDDARVLVLLTYSGRSKTHGAEMELDGGNLLTFREGKLARIELFFNRLDALEAAGLPQ